VATDRSADAVAFAAVNAECNGVAVQHDIARVLGTSRSNVSRMLSTARTLGVVEIRIQDKRGRDADLEQALAERFNLAHDRVAVFRPRQDAVAATGAVAAEWLDHMLRDEQTLALSSGAVVEAVVSGMTIEGPRAVEVVPLMGGLETGGSVGASQELVRELAARLGATYRCLHGPALLHSDSARDALLAEPSIGRILARVRSADLALVEIGTIHSQPASDVLKGLSLTDAQKRAFLSQNPIGNTGCRFYDGDGQPIRGIAHPGARGGSGRPPPHPNRDGSGDRSREDAGRARGAAEWIRRRVDRRRCPRSFDSQR
jgi:DNA-binding transcriptional regulator LsrR (DeoR family)